MRIAIFGNFGVDNKGDDMILQGLIKQFEGNELVVFCGNPQRVTKDFGLEAHSFFPGGFRSAVKHVRSAAYRKQIDIAEEVLNNADRVLIGGGGILVDRRLKAVALWLAQLKQIRKSGRPYEFIANSFELQRSWAVKVFLPYLRGAEEITVRDSVSQAFIQGLGLTAKLVPDLAYDADLPELSQKNAKKIGLALCRWGLTSDSLKSLRSFLDKKRSGGFEIVGMAFQSLGDDDREIFEKLDLQIPVLTDWPEIVKNLSECEILIGMRLHSLILADRLNIPSIALAYQEKVRNFMNDQRKGELVLSMDAVDEQKLQEIFLKAVAAPSE
jgi:polysaccharide pyruvyl transferase WcaK-like protein